MNDCVSPTEAPRPADFENILQNYSSLNDKLLRYVERLETLANKIKSLSNINSPGSVQVEQQEQPNTIVEYCNSENSRYNSLNYRLADIINHLEQIF